MVLNLEGVNWLAVEPLLFLLSLVEVHLLVGGDVVNCRLNSLLPGFQQVVNLRLGVAGKVLVTFNSVYFLNLNTVPGLFLVIHF